jgi:hypothetical protein
MSIAEQEPVSLSEDAITALIADPAAIPSHEVALEVLDVLDDEIANIQAQLDQAAAEAISRPLPPDRQAWYKRASYACAMRRNERHRIMVRDREIRNSKLFGGSPKDPEAKRLKQARLLEEAQTRKAAKLLKVEQEKTRQMEIAQRRRETDNKRRFGMSFIQRELDRIAVELRQTPQGEEYDKLYVAQQALSWAAEPTGFKAPFDMIKGVESSAESATPQLPQ